MTLKLIKSLLLSVSLLGLLPNAFAADTAKGASKASKKALVDNWLLELSANSMKSLSVEEIIARVDKND